MKHIIEKKWTTGSHKDICFYEVLNLSRDYVRKGSKIFIGSDSFINKGNICFATAVCLHGNGNAGRYFFFKDLVPKQKFTNLSSRITEETRRSIEIAELLVNEYGFDSCSLELHLDVSPISINNKTSRYSDMLKGYVQGFGLDCRLKPHAWASQTIADRHSK